MLIMVSSCNDSFIYETNPNQQTTSTFWSTEDDAIKGTIACYAGLQEEGTFKRWYHIAFAARADLTYSSTPFFPQLNFTRFNIVDYNEGPFQPEIWQDHYRGIFRTNQVIANVPNIDMDAGLKEQLLAEAHFLRAVYYFDLVNLWGNLPLQLKPSNPTEDAPYATEQEVWDQILADLKIAQKSLPEKYSESQLGRATLGAATAMLGKSYLQLNQWGEAKTEFQKIIGSNNYSLVENYRDNFLHTTENNSESIFEIQFSDEFTGPFWDKDLPNTSEGSRRGIYFGPRFANANADVSANKWFIEQFFKEKTKNGDYDPRLYATFMWNDTTNNKTDVLYYGKSFKDNIEPNRINDIYVRKYLQDYYKEVEDEHSPINYRLIRYADVLLMLAEADNESGQTSEAYPLINEVRARAEMRPLEEAYPEIGNNQDMMRARIEQERILELGGENVRWMDIKRWGYLGSEAGVEFLREHDSEFDTFNVGVNDLLPIPTREIDLNPNLKQNPGY